MEKQAKRSRAEKARRDNERHHLERISRLFRTSGTWSKKDVLSLGEIIPRVVECGWLLTKDVIAVLFLLYGPTIFPPGLLEARPAL